MRREGRNPLTEDLKPKIREEWLANAGKVALYNCVFPPALESFFQSCWHLYRVLSAQGMLRYVWINERVATSLQTINTH